MAGAARLFAGFKQRMADYHERRDFPALRGPSYLSVHLRFGTISIRALARAAWQACAIRGAAVWLSELIWRDFYPQILHHHPRVVAARVQARVRRIRVRTATRPTRCSPPGAKARTGYPLVDAAMAQINQTGYMHNRLRMVTASFLVQGPAASTGAAASAISPSS